MEMRRASSLTWAIGNVLRGACCLRVPASAALRRGKAGPKGHLNAECGTGDTRVGRVYESYDNSNNLQCGKWWSRENGQWQDGKWPTTEKGVYESYDSGLLHSRSVGRNGLCFGKSFSQLPELLKSRNITFKIGEGSTVAAIGKDAPGGGRRSEKSGRFQLPQNFIPTLNEKTLSKTPPTSCINRVGS